MADPFARVQPGQSFRPSASTWNGMIEAARDFAARKNGSRGGPELADIYPSALIVRVRNDSAADRDAFGVFAYDDAIIDPSADQEHAARRRPAFAGVAPVDASAPFVVTVEQAIEDGYARAVCSGLAVCRVSVSDADHTRAVPVVGTIANLASSQSGGCAIVWKESGTGTKWAVVLIGDPPGLIGQSDNGGGSLTSPTSLRTLDRPRGIYLVIATGVTTHTAPAGGGGTATIGLGAYDPGSSIPSPLVCPLTTVTTLGSVTATSASGAVIPFTLAGLVDADDTDAPSSGDMRFVVAYTTTTFGTAGASSVVTSFTLTAKRVG